MMKKKDKCDDKFAEICSKVIANKIQFVCEECCLPLSLYGENIILLVEGDKFVTHMLCDLHAVDFMSEE